MGDFEEEADSQLEEEQPKPTWSWRKLLIAVFGEENIKGKDKRTRKSLDSYNLYDRKPDFKNNYGWSVALDRNDYLPLKHSGIGIYLVNLTAVIDFFNYIHFMFSYYYLRIIDNDRIFG